MSQKTMDTSIETRLAGLEKGVNALLTATNLVIDTLQQQTNLLTELTAAAEEEPGKSPVVDAIDSLANAVGRMEAGIGALVTEMDELPDRLKVVLTGDAAKPVPLAATASVDP
jgi:uncharacterized coiled-coil protein SlyX